VNIVLGTAMNRTHEVIFTVVPKWGFSGFNRDHKTFTSLHDTRTVNLALVPCECRTGK